MARAWQCTVVWGAKPLPPHQPSPPAAQPGREGWLTEGALAALQEAKQGPGPGAQVNGESSLDHDTDDYTDYMDQDSMEFHQSVEAPAAKK